MTDVEAELRSYGVSVESLETGDPLSVAYLTAYPGTEIDHSEVGRALNALLELAEADRWDPVRVEATVLRAPGDPLGTWYAEPEWFRALLDYEISETEFSTRVLRTLSHGDRDESDADGPGVEGTGHDGAEAGGAARSGTDGETAAAETTDARDTGSETDGEAGS